MGYKSKLYKSIITVYYNGNKQNEDNQGIKYQYLYLESISINEPFLDNVMAFLSTVDCDTFNRMIIEKPKRSTDKLRQIQNRYIKFPIVTKNYQHPQYRTCTRHYIRHERMKAL